MSRIKDYAESIYGENWTDKVLNYEVLEDERAN